jgi:hypothetical protein
MRLRTGYLSIVTGMSFLCGCVKESLAPSTEADERVTGLIAGLPPDMTKVNGYFYSMQTWSHPYSENKFDRSRFATFAVQGGDLRKGWNFILNAFDNSLAVGDLDVGKIFEDTCALQRNSLTGPRLFYGSSSLSMTPSGTGVTWHYTGTGDVSADTFCIPNAFPLLKSRGRSQWVNPDTSFTILVDTIMDHYMEGSASLIGSHYRGGPYIALSQLLNESMRHFYLSAKQVKSTLTADGYSPPGTLRFMTFNHFHQYKHGKLYVFTFCVKVDYSVSIYK